jgi:hypothetical protein
MIAFLTVLAVVLAGAALYQWYRYEVVIETEGTVRLQSEHEHFHLHLDLPNNLEVLPGDTVHILELPALEDGRTEGGEMSYTSPVHLHRASWLNRHLIKTSSIVEVTELIEDN